MLDDLIVEEEEKPRLTNEVKRANDQELKTETKVDDERVLKSKVVAKDNTIEQVYTIGKDRDIYFSYFFDSIELYVTVFDPSIDEDDDDTVASFDVTCFY